MMVIMHQEKTLLIRLIHLQVKNYTGMIKPNLLMGKLRYILQMLQDNRVSMEVK